MITGKRSTAFETWSKQAYAPELTGFTRHLCECEKIGAVNITGNWTALLFSSNH
jgi:hypothetical protein